MEDDERRTTLGELDENVRACVLVHLTPRDLAHVALTCRALASDSQRDIVWATLFLRRFGSDFWGEHITTIHPYHEVPSVARNKWLDLLPVSVFEAFLQESERSAGASEVAEKAQEDEARRGLLSFVQQHGRSGDQGLAEGGWKAAYKRMHEMVQTWSKNETCIAYLVAGLTSFERLSSIMDVIKEAALTGDFREVEARRVTRKPASPHECIDITSPGGEDLFRGLQVKSTNWGGKRFFLVYALDCERMQEPDYQEDAFRELHGILGEGKGEFKEGIYLNLFLINPTKEYGTSRILERLKIPVLIAPRHWCPYYAGPVICLVTEITMPHDDTSEDAADREIRAKRILQSFVWLCFQPAGRAHWDVPNEPHTFLCALTDKRSERERSGQFHGSGSDFLE